jgi:hypothetical protein
VSNRRLILAWLPVAAALAWGIGATVKQAADLQLSNKLWLTLLPLLLGVAVCVFFRFLDRSRFTVRGVVGPYFASVALLFAVFSSLLAAELWQRQSREDALFRSEVNGLKSMLHIAGTLDSGAPEIRNAVKSYLEQAAYSAGPGLRTAGGEHYSDNALQWLYRLASDPKTFGGDAVANTAFFNSLEVVRSSREERAELHKARVAPKKFFILVLFGLLTQIAIAFCHAGNPRALGASVMLFSIAFSAAIAVLSLLDDPYESFPVISVGVLNGPS